MFNAIFSKRDISTFKRLVTTVMKAIEKFYHLEVDS